MVARLPDVVGSQPPLCPLLVGTHADTQPSQQHQFPRRVDRHHPDRIAGPHAVKLLAGGVAQGTGFAKVLIGRGVVPQLDKVAGRFHPSLLFEVCVERLYWGLRRKPPPRSKPRDAALDRALCQAQRRRGAAGQPRPGSGPNGPSDDRTPPTGAKEPGRSNRGSVPRVSRHGTSKALLGSPHPGRLEVFGASSGRRLGRGRSSWRPLSPCSGASTARWTRAAEKPYRMRPSLQVAVPISCAIQSSTSRNRARESALLMAVKGMLGYLSMAFSGMVACFRGTRGCRAPSRE